MSSIFVSYCRREAPFVESVVTELEKAGHDVWLDYKSMVPGQPWAPQLEKGIEEADTIILVISKESMASKYVRGEWQRAIKDDDRIILVLFEAVPLPSELTNCEWVDLRTSFSKGVKQLLKKIEAAPQKPEQPAPQSGFKAPRNVWLAFVLSLFTAVLSIFCLWTIILPYVLVPLPYRIFKRDYDYSRVQFSNILLPFSLLGASLIVASNTNLSDNLVGYSFLAAPISILFFFVFRSATLQRWGKPIASRPKFAHVTNPSTEKNPPILYALDYASADGKYAKAIKKTLNDYGHQQTENLDEAQAALVLVSAYKSDSAINSEEQVVYPIILQTNDEISDDLQQIQWIDMRRGLKNLSSLAHLLPEPAQLLRAIGVAPSGGAQTVLPRSIQALVFFLSILAMFMLGSYIPILFEFFEGFSFGNGLAMIGSLILYIGVTAFMVNALVSRRVSFWWLVALFILLILLYYAGYYAIDAALTNAGVDLLNEDEFRGLASSLPSITFMVGVVIITLLTIKDRHDFWRWFPVKEKRKNS